MNPLRVPDPATDHIVGPVHACAFFFFQPLVSEHP